jgi:hypothetical protein
MKAERNASCPCGSGQKYKKCCANKPETVVAQNKMSADSLMFVIAFGLENANLLTEKADKVKVKTVSFANGGDTIVVEFYAKYSQSNDIKVEIAYIMGFLYSFLKDDAYQGFNIKMFAAKAFDENEVEILYAINNREAASAIINGNTIEWYKTTIFQVNTPDYRLSRAKTMISDIENGLRKAISRIYENKHGTGWWDTVIEPKVSSGIKNTYENQFGALISDGNILINYTYTLDLKKIISANWGTFRHLFESKTIFEALVVELNVIRREEAHNRDISEAHLVDLERIYDALLGEIASGYPAVTTNYLVDNWRDKIREAVANPVSCVYTASEFEAQDILGQRLLIIKDCNAQIGYIGNILSKLQSLKAPASKKKKHEEMVLLLDQMMELQSQKLHKTESLEFDNYQQLIKNIDDHGVKMNIFSREFLIAES